MGIKGGGVDCGSRNAAKPGKMSLSKVLDDSADDDFAKALSESWDFSSFDNFVLSFEKMTEQQNVVNAKKYGNIAKRMVSKILENDTVPFDPITGRPLNDKEILAEVRSNKEIMPLFERLYFEIQKRNKWKLEMPYISQSYDLMIDRYGNDYKRLVVSHLFIFENKSIPAKRMSDKKKVMIRYSSLDSHAKNEMEKVYYKLLNRVRNKRNGMKMIRKLQKLKGTNRSGG